MIGGEHKINLNELNCYEILQVSRNASIDIIHAAYLSLAKINHPNNEGDAETMKKINSAYETLTDPILREQYNKKLKQEEDRSKFVLTEVKEMIEFSLSIIKENDITVFAKILKNNFPEYINKYKVEIQNNLIKNVYEDARKLDENGFIEIKGGNELLIIHKNTPKKSGYSSSKNSKQYIDSESKDAQKIQWYKRLPKIPTIIFLLLLLSLSFRWEVVASSTRGGEVRKWEKDRWTGSIWVNEYDYYHSDRRPTSDNGSATDNATAFWWIAFIGTAGYIIYRIRKD